ncbi:MAG: transcription elongation factor GreA [Candidatus Giovannonibacteria bacterium GW2011_GWC2_44_8]|uniref:Transcription elongation factor GreA n=1 Tax=Candidatus Giovannonibacteria bacterium GW2011_GWC2_44_8 TaxID=1618657 RepID=A0A0G1K090_9BACT|nr:MAG: transcription elongation factor GreA [Candidatus Giovannonibacteria bacterium GW2011_GWC2_44_8]
MKKLFNLTQDGLEELKQELKRLLDQRHSIAERIKQARELGDLSENAEYQTAREEQDRLETRIGELEHVVHNSKLIKKPKDNGHVKLGSSVKLKSEAGKTTQFQVVGTMEADPLNSKISDESPIGKVLMNKKVGDKVEIKASAQNTTYKIVSIN